MECTSFLKFGENMELIEVTQEEVADWPAEVKSLMVKVRRSLEYIKAEK